MHTVDITDPRFTARDLSEVAMIDRKLVNLWLERELIEPTLIKLLEVRKRPMFSVVGIYKARLMRLLTDHLQMSTSGLKLAGSEIAKANRRGAAAASGIKSVAHAIADTGFLWAVKRSVDENRPLARDSAGKPLALYGAVALVDDCWDFHLDFDLNELATRFASEVPFALIPVESTFASVYRQCLALSFGEQNVK